MLLPRASLALAFGLAITLPLRAAGIQLDHEFQEFRTGTYLSMKIDGSYKVETSSFIGWKDPFVGFDILSDDELRSRLEISSTQDSRLKRALEAYSKSLTEIRSKHLPKDESIAEIGRARDKLSTELTNLLSDEQIENLEQMVHRSQLRAVGLGRYVQLVAKTQGLELSQTASRKIRLESMKRAEQVLRDCKDSCAKAMEELVKDLPEQVREPFEKELGETPKTIALDILQLSSQEVIELLEAETDKPRSKKDFEEILRANRGFSLNACGEWRSNQHESALSSAVLKWFLNLDQIGFLGLELVDQQQAQLEQLCNEIRRLTKENNREVNEMFDHQVDENTIKEFLRKNTADMQLYVRRTLFDEILLPHQLDTFTRVMEARELLQLGPLRHIVTLTQAHPSSRDGALRAMTRFGTALQEIEQQCAKKEYEMISEILSEEFPEGRTTVLKGLGEKSQFKSFSFLLFDHVYDETKFSNWPNE